MSTTTSERQRWRIALYPLRSLNAGVLRTSKASLKLEIGRRTCKDSCWGIKTKSQATDPIILHHGSNKLLRGWERHLKQAKIFGKGEAGFKKPSSLSQRHSPCEQITPPGFKMRSAFLPTNMVLSKQSMLCKSEAHQAFHELYTLKKNGSSQNLDHLLISPILQPAGM